MKAGTSQRYRQRQRYDVVDCGFDTPCHLWLGGVNERGYPNNGIVRQFWTLTQGPIPKTLRYNVHHLCEQRRCVNVDHMELRLQGDHQREHLKGRPKSPQMRAALRAHWANMTHDQRMARVAAQRAGRRNEGMNS